MKKIVIFLAVLSLTACKKGILDIQPLDKISEEAVWKDENLIRAYEAELYNAIPHGFGSHGMLSKHTDEAVNTTPCCGPDIFARSTWNGDNITAVDNGDNQWLYYWNRGYVYVRKINVFMEKLALNQIPLADKAKLIAEAKFIRAMVYFNLLERFGGVPIVEKSYQLGENPKFQRATIDETVAYIDKNLAEAIPDLPQKYAANDAANFGRATKDACLALRSRLFLYAASPLYAGAKDNAKWQKAADAAQALLSSGYSLYPDYKLAFNRPSGSANDELIFAKNFTVANGHQAPMHNLGRRYQAYGGWWASNGPSQNLVDDYDMATTGLPAFTFTGSGKTVTKTVNALSGYDAGKPYANRDPRFDATVIHDESTFHGDFYEMWVSADAQTYGFDSYKQSSDNPRSGYIVRKFMPEDQPLNWQTQYTIPWPVFRLAEIYLNYAEAKFELGDEATAREYLNKVRARPTVNMPPIPATVTGEALRQRIYNERRVELAFESHRFFDVRRWKIAMDIENRPLYGMDVIKAPSGTKTYTPFKQLEKVFEDRMHWLPIENNEIRRTGIPQNPNW